MQDLLDYCLVHCKCGTCFQCNFYSKVLGVKGETSTENMYYSNSSHLWILFYTFKCNTHISDSLTPSMAIEDYCSYHCSSTNIVLV